MKKPRLYLFVGYPGAGKTTIAKIIQDATGAVHIWADNARQRMFQHPTHSEEESLALYHELNRQTEALLAQGKSVIFDTNFNHRADRDFLGEIADRQHADVVIVWVVTPKETAKQRAVHSNITRNGYEYIMNEEQFEAIAGKLETPDAAENVIKIDGTEIDSQTVKRLLKLNTSR